MDVMEKLKGCAVRFADYLYCISVDNGSKTRRHWDSIW